MPALDANDLAARYGWSMAILNSNPELASLFQQAVAGTWTPEKFTAELRNTNWFKTNSETARQAALLRSTDPATYNTRIAEKRQSILPIAIEMGAMVPGSVMQSIAEQAMALGWNEQQIRNAMSVYVKESRGQYLGNSAQNAAQMREFASQMGIRLSEKTVASWVRTVATGTTSLQTHLGQIRELASSAFPQFRERFEAGETLDDVASPYKQTMATLLELSPESIDNFDSTVRGALSAKDAKTGKPAMKSLWEFENDLRKDKRWLKTANAQDAAASTVNRVLSDMGLISRGG